MILSGMRIAELLGSKIFIDPFDASRINPNSYNLSLHNELLVYTNESRSDNDDSVVTLDMKSSHTSRCIEIPPHGLLLKPHTLYLGRTVEYTKTYDYVPMLEGRSSVGRLGLYVHVTAGFGDVGFEGYWTLEMHCIHPIVIYPFVEICQIFYHSIEGDYQAYSSGKYQKNNGIQSSMMYKDFLGETP